jgi:hypothetical protein
MCVMHDKCVPHHQTCTGSSTPLLQNNLT